MHVSPVARQSDGGEGARADPECARAYTGAAVAVGVARVAHGRAERRPAHSAVAAEGAAVGGGGARRRRRRGSTARTRTRVDTETGSHRPLQQSLRVAALSPRATARAVLQADAAGASSGAAIGARAAGGAVAEAGGGGGAGGVVVDGRFERDGVGDPGIDERGIGDRGVGGPRIGGRGVDGPGRGARCPRGRRRTEGARRGARAGGAISSEAPRDRGAALDPERGGGEDATSCPRASAGSVSDSRASMPIDHEKALRHQPADGEAGVERGIDAGERLRVGGNGRRHRRALDVSAGAEPRLDDEVRSPPGGERAASRARRCPGARRARRRCRTSSPARRRSRARRPPSSAMSRTTRSPRARDAALPRRPRAGPGRARRARGAIPSPRSCARARRWGCATPRASPGRASSA